MNKKPLITIGLLLLLVGFAQGLVAIAGLVSKAGGLNASALSAYNIEPFEKLDIEAESVFVFDMIRDETIYEHNANKIQALASITKLMTAIVALEELGPDAIITITTESVETEGDNGLLAYEKWQLDELLRFTLVVSSNDATRAIVEAYVALEPEEDPVDRRALFLRKLNEKADELDLPSLYFADESGLDFDDFHPSAYGSARDVSLLMMYGTLTYPDVFKSSAEDKLIFTSVEGFVHEAENTNEVSASIPGLVASKTGFTTIAQGNLSFIFEAGPARPISVVVLNSTFKGRFSDAKKLVDATLQSISGYAVLDLSEGR